MPYFCQLLAGREGRIRSHTLMQASTAVALNAATAWRITRAQARDAVRVALPWARARARVPVSFAPGGRALSAALAMGLGAAAYVAPAQDPAMVWAWLALFVAALGGAAAAVTGRGRLVFAAVLVASFCAGAIAMEARTQSLLVDVPAYDSERAEITGWVERVDVSANGRRRLVLRVLSLDGAPVPAGLRVRVTTGARAVPAYGDVVAGPARLSPPPSSDAPGGYDFARAAYFQRVALVGYTLGPLSPLGAGDGSATPVGTAIRAARPAGFAQTVELAERALAAERGRMAARLAEAGGARAGGVVAALVTGVRSEVSPAASEALRASGLGHILAISGLHLALVAGGAFVLFTRLIAAIEPLARRLNPRKPAAFAALAAALGYLMLSGAAVSTQRACIMAAVAFVAILADRRAVSLRGVALAALLILALRPESALDAGFHMSFAAAAALVAAYEKQRRARRLAHAPVGGGLHAGLDPARARDASVGGIGGEIALATGRGPGGFFSGVAFTSFIAGSATAPLAAYHFHRLAQYGFVANLAAMPIFTLVVMPAAALAGLMVPFGLEAWPAAVAGWSMALVLDIAALTASQPGALAGAPAAPPVVLALIALAVGGACAADRGALRILAVTSAAALGVWFLTPQPALWIGPAGGIAVRPVAPIPETLISGTPIPDVWSPGEEAPFAGAADAASIRDGPGISASPLAWSQSDRALLVGAVRAPRTDAFAARRFLERGGNAAALSGAPPPDLAEAGRCDAWGCVLQLKHTTLAIVTRADQLVEDCNHADVILLAVPAPARLRAACPADMTVIPAWPGAGPARRLYERPTGGFRVRESRKAARPWSPP